MPFYDALKYILTTANGKIRRKDWGEGYYVTRGFEGKILKILLIVPHIDGPISYNFEAKSHDMIAADWEIVKESH